jgi:sulfur carrier protein
MKIVIRNPKRRELELTGKRRVQDMLRELGLNPESVLVIRRGEMLTRDEMVDADDTIEILSAISGG